MIAWAIFVLPLVLAERPLSAVAKTVSILDVN
jgi:hypothetical protein